MYPSIKPALKLKSTISHPIRSEEVIGFIGRNKNLGRRAIVMKKKTSLAEGKVAVPNGAVDGLLNGVGELVVLGKEKVLTMEASQFSEKNYLHTISGRGKKATVNCVDLQSEAFCTWERSAIEVTN